MRTRREFIRQTLLSSATLAVATACGQLGRSAPDKVDAAAIEKLRASLSGQLILPGDKVYEAARRVASWNPVTDRHPSMIVRCTEADDVARCLDFARQHEVLVAVRSGGHSFLGWSTCDDGLVIDLSSMKNVAIDPLNRTVRAGAGVIARELVVAAAPYGLAPVLGECPTVGIAGLTLGGGLGWMSGKWGAACDNLLSANVITVDSRSVVASAVSNSDLFWAIRGGGGNFGVATSFEYRLHAVDEVLAGGFTYPLRHAAEVLRFYREFMAAAPDELQALAYLTPAGDGALNVIVVYVGDPNQGNRVVDPFRAVVTPIRDTEQRRAYTETFTMPPYGEFVPSTFSAIKGSYLKELSDDAIDIALERFAQAPSECAIGFDHYVHGEVCRIAPDSTAFELRTPGALHVWISPAWDDPAATVPSMRWAEDTWKLLQPYSGGRIYANYMSVEGEPATKAVFGSNYSRLVSIKRKYDPHNILRRNQNIRPIES